MGFKCAGTIGKSLVAIGDASYSIYLAHPFAQRVFLLAVIHFVGLPNINANVYMFSTFFISIVAGVICYLILERPVLHAKSVCRLD